MDSIQMLEQTYLEARKECFIAKEAWIQAKKDQWTLDFNSKVIETMPDGTERELKALLEYGDYFLISATTGRDWNGFLKGKNGQRQTCFDSMEALKDAICESNHLRIINEELPKREGVNG